VRVRWSAILVVTLLPLAVVPLVGTWVATVSGALAVLVASLLLIGRVGGRPRGLWWTALVPGLAWLGTLVGAVNAAYVLVTLGGEMPYRERASFGWVALGLAVIAGSGGIVAKRRPAVGALVIVGAGLLGSIAINLLSIDSGYLLAVPLWLVAAVAALTAAALREHPRGRASKGPLTH
jgi:hypothetical protein